MCDNSALLRIEDTYIIRHAASISFIRESSSSLLDQSKTLKFKDKTYRN